MFSHHLTSKRSAIGARTHTHPVAFELTLYPFMQEDELLFELKLITKFQIILQTI